MSPSFKLKLSFNLKSFLQKIKFNSDSGSDHRTILVLVGSGLLILLLGLIFFREPSRSSSFLNRKEPLGWAEPISGNTYLLEKGQMVRRNLESRTALHHLESIETQELSEAQIELNDGTTLQVNENSMVAVEQVKESRGTYTLITLLKGEIKVLSSSQESPTWISKNGKRVLAAEYEKSELSQAPLRPLRINSIPEQQEANAQSETQPPTEIEISEALQRNRNSFFKCYAQLLQKEPEAKGELTLNFTLETSGNVKNAEVSSQLLADKSFHDCLVTVLKRIEFRSFSGAPVSTIFPMKFE